MNNWPHQDYTLTELDRVIASGDRRICIAIPTGGGKTRVMFQHAESRLPAAIYTHRRMLLTQHGDNLERSGIRFGYRASGMETRLMADLQLCMIQTEASRVLKGTREIHPASIVYVDEAHANSGDQMQQLVARHAESNPGMVTVWVTATPLGLSHVCDSLIIGATNSDLRTCGALVPARHFGPDEPDTKWVGKVTVDNGECGIAQNKRMEFAQRVFGSIVEHYLEYNPEQLPTIGFAPDVESGLWLAETCDFEGIPAAFISGSKIWYGREQLPNTQELRDQIAAEHKDGKIKIVWNRFVLREGIDWPWVYHGIFATVFGSLTSYIQAGGRLLRAHPGKEHCVVQDHGGNWWRHGSLNSDREWQLTDTDRIVSGIRETRLREKTEPEPIRCPKCDAMRLSGPKCFNCGYEHTSRSRIVLQKDGTLKEMRGDIYRKRRVLSPSEAIEKEWRGRIKAVMRSGKPSVKNATPAQVEVWMARDNNWQYPPRGIPMQPVNEADWFRPVKDITEWTG